MKLALVPGGLSTAEPMAPAGGAIEPTGGAVQDAINALAQALADESYAAAIHAVATVLDRVLRAPHDVDAIAGMIVADLDEGPL